MGNISSKFSCAGLARFRLFALLAAMLLLGGCWDETVTRNIRVIAKAEVGGKVVEGSAVMGIRWISKPDGQMWIKTNTEAVILELDGRGTVYILNAFFSKQGQTNAGYWPLVLKRTLGVPGQGRLEDFPVLRSAQGRYEVRPPIKWGPKTLPVMVSFKDESKRETMFQVKPEDFPKYFGRDVRFLGLWFEFTDDPPTDHGIRERLPVMWNANSSYLASSKIRDKDGNPIPSRNWTLPEKLGKSVFRIKDY